MKKIERLCILVLVVFLMTGCGDKNSSRKTANSSSSVDKVINEQIDGDDDASGNTDTNSQAEEDITTEENSDTDSEAESSGENTSQGADGVDCDLTTMSSDMVYATVYQMMTDPDSYTGKTIRMDGLYYAGYDEWTKKYYHYCVIQDATACCAQGLEFVWDDGSHVYPDEYPQDNAEVVVQGVFETYQEDGSDYCRLKEASLEVK